MGWLYAGEQKRNLLLYIPAWNRWLIAVSVRQAVSANEKTRLTSRLSFSALLCGVTVKDVTRASIQELEE